jgi:hypothetical protein
VATHEIEMNQTTRIVGKTDVVFVVSSGIEGKLGELRLSRGGVDWSVRSRPRASAAPAGARLLDERVRRMTRLSGSGGADGAGRGGVTSTPAL